MFEAYSHRGSVIKISVPISFSLILKKYSRVFALHTIYQYLNNVLLQRRIARKIFCWAKIAASSPRIIYSITWALLKFESECCKSTLWASLCSFVFSSKFGCSYKYYLLLQVPLFEKCKVSVIGHKLIGKRNQSYGQVVYENPKPTLCYSGKGKLKIMNYRFSCLKFHQMFPVFIAMP